MVKFRAKINGLGFTAEFVWQHPKDGWLDTEILIEHDPSLETGNVKSVSFYMSVNEIQRFASYVVEKNQFDDSEPYSFVPTNLGFEMSIFDADEAEATMQLLLNVGTTLGNRVYTGTRAQVKVSEPVNFADKLYNVAQQTKHYTSPPP